MFQVGTNLLLHDVASIWKDQASKIELRGYSAEEPVAISPGFLMAKLDGSFKTLSVETITSKYCPVRRDLYLEKVKRIKARQSTWGRVAGPLIESYCVGLLDLQPSLYAVMRRMSYSRLQAIVESYTEDFVRKHEGRFGDLGRKAQEGEPEDNPANLILALKYTARHELAMLVAHWFLKRSRKSPSLVTEVPIRYKPDESKIEPAEYIGVGKLATPDFIILQPLAIGDLKSGDSLKRFHLHTCAGYALAYESQFGQGNEVNYGIVYFFGTHSRTLNSAQSYVFLLDDRLRQEFLDMRDEAYKVLQSPSPPPPLTGEVQKTHCVHCKYRKECDKDRDA